MMKSISKVKEYLATVTDLTMYISYSEVVIEKKLEKNESISYVVYQIIKNKILGSLKGEHYLVKYFIYEENFKSTPFYNFETKNSISNMLNHIRNMNSRFKSLSIRIDFIDIDANLNSFYLLIH